MAATATTFPIIQSCLNLQSEQYRANATSWKPVLAEYEAALEQTSSEDNLESLARHVKRGQLLGQ